MGYMEAVKRPFSDIVKLVIGIVVLMIPIVNFIGMGYFIQCARMTLKKQSGMPAWKGWGGLFVTGLVAAVISAIWAIPTLLVAFFLLGSVFSSVAPALAAVQGGNAMTMASVLPALMASIGSVMMSAVVVFIVWALFGLLGIAAIMGYADKGRFSAAFDFKTIGSKAFKGEFIAAWIVGLVYTLVVVAILSFIPFVGTMIAAFIGQVTFLTMVAEAYRGSAAPVPVKKSKK